MANNNQGVDKLLGLFEKPKLIGVVGDPDQAKSNLLYWLITELQKRYTFRLFSYGLKLNAGEQKIHTIEELEVIENAVVILDEISSLFDLEARGERRQMEETMRLIFHNGNVILFSGLPESFHKFLASRMHVLLFKRCTIKDAINGSRVKTAIVNYHGEERGSTMLNVEKDEVLVFDGAHYEKFNVPYLERFDTKRNNPPILHPKDTIGIAR